MPYKGEGFNEVASRLKMALDIESDAELAEKLGFSARAWSQRKTRESIPKKEIDELIAQESLNPEWVYSERGSVHLAVDGDAWADAFQRRLVRLLDFQTAVNILARNGWSPKALKTIEAGKQMPSIELLRDMRKFLHVDLHTLICDEPPIKPDELALIENYRRSTQDGRKLMEQVGSYIVNKPE